MEKHGWLIWAVLPLLIAAGLWWLTQRPADLSSSDVGFVGNERTTGPVPTRAELAEMQARAENACRCSRQPRRAGGRPPSCWQEFDRAVGRFEHSEMVAACVPLSTVAVCFGGEQCITRDHGGGACTAEEARTIDAIWTQAMREGGGSRQRSERANARVAQAIQSFIRGERVTVPQTSGGCLG